MVDILGSVLQFQNLKNEQNGETIVSAYMIFDVRRGDDRDAMKPYGEKVMSTLEPYGGKIIAASDDVVVRECDWDFDRILIVEFPSMEAAQAWYDSPEYQEILPIRLKANSDQMVIVDGLSAD